MTAHEKHFTFGDYTATITGKMQGRMGGIIPPTLRIFLNTGNGIFDYTDVHFSQAKQRHTLNERLIKFAASKGYHVTSVSELADKLT